MKTFNKLIFILAVLGSTLLNANAEPVAGALVFISPRDYTLDTSVGADAYQYTFNQGPTVQPIAIAALSPLFADTEMCANGDESAVAIWIKPSLSFDPIVTLYYGTIVAKVFDGSGSVVGSYTGNVQRSGNTDIYPDKQIDAVYEAVMQQVVQQMQADPNLQNLINHGLPENVPKMPCNMIMLMNGADQ